MPTPDDPPPSVAAAPLPRLLGLQYLRAVAAFGVVLFHAAGATKVFDIGARGVDLFFVLSGFLMVAITRRGTRPWPFLKARILRVVPLYWLATLAAVLAASVGFYPAVALDPANIVRSLLFVPYGIPSGGELYLPILTPGWTLNAEMLFYVLFAGTLFLPRRAQVPAMIGVLVVAVAIGRATPHHSAIVGAWTQPILLEFAVGMALTVLWVRARAWWIAPVVLVIGWCIATRAGVAHWPLDSGTAAGLIVFAVLSLERRGNGLPRWRPIELLGDASYSIYIWHEFGVILGGAIGKHLALGLVATIVLKIVAAIGGSLVAWLLLEKPLLRWTHGRALTRRTLERAAVAY